MYDGIRLRIEIEGMRETILHHFMLQQGEIAKAVQSELERTLADVDLNEAVRSHVEHIMPQAVSDTVKDAIRRALNSGPAKEGFDALVADAVARFFSDARASRLTNTNDQ